MYFHALYTGTVPWDTSNGSLLSMMVKVSPAVLSGEAEPTWTGTIPFISSPGFLAMAEIVTSGLAQDGRGYSFPCGVYHAGEEVV
jgi:hypothetical protein